MTEKVVVVYLLYGITQIAQFKNEAHYENWKWCLENDDLIGKLGNFQIKSVYVKE